MKKFLPWVIAIIVVAGAAFYAGMQYEKSSILANPQSFFTNNRQALQSGVGNANGFSRRNGTGTGGGAGIIIGTIAAKDDKSITVNLQSGGSKIIFYSTSTEVSKFTSGVASDLQVGKTVMVNGKSNSDGSLTAQTIQLRPNLPANQ